MNRRGKLLLGVYLVLASSEWMFTLRFPSSLPSAELFCMGSIIVWISFLMFAPRTEVSERAGHWRRGVGGTVLFSVAWVVSGSGSIRLPASTQSALLTVAPVAILLAGAMISAEELDFLSLLGAAIAGVGGVFLLLPADPESLLRSPVAFLAVIGVVGCVGVGSWGVYRAARELSKASWISSLLLPGMVVSAGMLVWGGRGFSAPRWGDLPQIAWEAAEMGLLVYLLSEVEPVPLSARFLMVPLLGVAKGLVVVRPELTWRLVVGAGLLLYGSVRLLRGGRVRDSRLSLL